MKVLVTGTAGFIGYHLAERLLARGDEVVGVDIVNAYYDPALKEARLNRLRAQPGFVEERVDLADRTGLEKTFATHKPQRVVNLAAQAGVRYSVENPYAYVDSNLVGFVNVLECCRQHEAEHLVYAATSSVYGANANMPFLETDGVAHPMSLYAATKRANEVMAHSYSHLFKLPTTGLRFFTVYGPWGRPDMALFKFTRAILAGEPIPVFNNGNMKRDFTYVDDIVEGIVRVLDRVPDADPTWDPKERTPAPDRSGIAPFRLYNIGRGAPVDLMDYIRTLEEKLGMKAQLDLLPMQPGDVAATFADTSSLERDAGYKPATPISVGINNFVDWYRAYYQI